LGLSPLECGQKLRHRPIPRHFTGVLQRATLHPAQLLSIGAPRGQGLHHASQVVWWDDCRCAARKFGYPASVRRYYGAARRHCLERDKAGRLLKSGKYSDNILLA
jgi:hypothetical protein